MCRFLRFVVTEVVRGNEAACKEYPIGIAVFDRGADFDPRVDSIVRVEARRLRNKLALYYSTEGVSDEIVIQFQKGSYTPCFRRRMGPSYSRAGLHRPSQRSWKAVAVLPFAAATADDDRSFTDGLAQEIISAVANTAGFRVVARTSAFQYGGRSEDGCLAGRELAADSVVCGWVSSEAGCVRVHAQIVNVREGVYSWTDSFLMEEAEEFAAQERIATAVVDALRAEVKSR